MGIKTVNAILIHTQDVEGLAAFYRDKVGLPLTVSNHGGGLHAEADLGSFHFAIFPGGGEAVAKGPVTFSLHSDDVDADYEALKLRGVEFESPPSKKPFGGVTAPFRDPDGNGVVLMCWQSEYDT